jgi:hypothetical protein
MKKRRPFGVEQGPDELARMPVRKPNRTGFEEGLDELEAPRSDESEKPSCWENAT